LSISLLKNCKIYVKATSTQTWTVDDDGPADFKTIQEAINNASAGDTIFVHNGTYYENVVINKTVTLIGENKDFTIINGNGTGNVVEVAVDNASIRGFTIMRSGDLPYSGVFVKPLSLGNVIITNNIIIGNSYGIYLSLSNNNNVSNNLISNNVYGIGLTSCSNNLIFGNTILSNINDGIYLLTSFSNYISYNVILYNQLTGISLYNSADNIVYGNIISNNLFYGIFFYLSINNMVSVNTITDNPSGGVVTVFSSNNNTIYHNNFNNVVQVYSKDSTNFWSYGSDGNYWSDYCGLDLNGDGIGDIPYVIPETNQTDNAPLMGRFSEFNITYKDAIHQVTIISNSSISDFQFQVGTETGNKIIRFKPNGNESVIGFCRVSVPTAFMSYPYILLLGSEEINPVFLDISTETHVYLYFTYSHRNQTITLISCEWYSELIDIYSDLNATYYNLLNIYGDLLYNYTILLGNYTQLQESFEMLNASYQYLYDLNVTFYNFLEDYARLQEDFYHLNEAYSNLANLYGKLQEDFDNLSLTHQSLFNAFVLLLSNFTKLQEDYQVLNASYQDHLRSYSENLSKVQNLTYVIAATTAILIMVTAYLSKRAHSSGTPKFKRFEEE
jgi:parallel beta-helix repeat protein